MHGRRRIIFENKAFIVPAGRSSSILERSGERDFLGKAQSRTFCQVSDILPDLEGGDKERTMEIEALIRELENLIGEADMAADAGSVDEARELLRTAKELLDDEFLAE